MKKLFPILCLIAMPFLLSLIGAESLQISEILNIDTISHRIYFDLRLPRVLLLIMAGGALAMLGGTYQLLLHNPLAEPYILGISSAVTLGAVIGEVFFHVSAQSVAGLGFSFTAAAMAVGFLLLVAYSHFGQEPTRIVLFGMAMNFLLSSTLFLILSYYSQQMGGGALRWLFGQVPWVSMREVAYFAMMVVPMGALLIVLARNLDALAMGDTVARTMGVSPVWARNLLLLLTSGFVAVIVSFTGSVGFVGLVVPHAVRLLFRPGTSRALLAVSFLGGGCFLVLADVGSRTLLPPFEFPIGVVTTLIGAPPFLYLLWKR